MGRPKRDRIEQPRRAALPRGKRWLFGGAVAVASVGLFFGAVEGALRLFGYGHETRFYRVVQDGDGTRWLRENQDFALTFFPPELVRRPHPFRLPAEKPPGTYRVFVLGESAARGDPAPSFSIPRALETMLRTAYPQIRFEVVNTGITAINSHAVRAIAADCARMEPDLFVFYGGNNEVIGPFGPTAVLAPFMRSGVAIDAILALRRTRTGQLLGNATRALGSGKPDMQRWGGMTLFLEHEVGIDDPRLASVEALFARNLRAIAASARSAGAHTIMCTVLTNQRDFAPFRSRHRDTLGEASRQKWAQAVAAGARARVAGDLRAAETAWRAAWAIDDQMAELAFQLGRLSLAQNRDREAASYFARALDCDTLRFRTDSRLQAAIRGVAQQTGSSVELLDLAAAIAADSPHGIVGDEALYEHVHLTMRGTWQVARLLFARVSEDLRRRGLVDAIVSEPLSLDETQRRLGYTVFEQAMIVDELLERFSHPPFTGQSDHAARMAKWRERKAALARMEDTARNRRELEGIYEHALAASPDDWMLARNYGWMLAEFGEAARAIPLLARADATIDTDTDTILALARAYRAAGRGEEAARYFARLRALSPGHPGLNEAGKGN